MAEISGIGERKLNKYGADFLAVIDGHLGEA
jgi:superfamily II DNA helicase RecQ